VSGGIHRASTRPPPDLHQALTEASLPCLDFVARWLYAKVAAFEEDHPETSALLTVFRQVIDVERDARYALLQGTQTGGNATAESGASRG